MSDYYIGIMTGNSMDAVDMVYATVDENAIHPIYTFSQPFSGQMQSDIAQLRADVKHCKSRNNVLQLPRFRAIHDAYIHQIADAVCQFIADNQIPLETLKAICSHGKTLDHCPPSLNTPTPYTLQIGSGKMLADEIARRCQQAGIYDIPKIRVIYDFRSDDILNGGEGAPLIPPLNAFIARQEKCLNRIDINAGNTSNLCLICNGEAVAGWDIGPCNEYLDYLVRRHTDLPFDIDGQIAGCGSLNKTLFRQLFEIGADFYTIPPPRSGDPAYYHTKEIALFQDKTQLADNLYTVAYLAGYLVVYALQFIKGEIPATFSLFGGGWKHPIIRQSLDNILRQNASFILPEHKEIFKNIYQRLGTPLNIAVHPYGQWMESLLWARMGYCFDQRIPWTTPALTGCKTPTICGIEAVSDLNRPTNDYDDCISRAYYQ